MKVAPLTKVTLSVAAESEESKTAEESPPHPISFIYGIGLSGLTAFECALAGREDDKEMHLCLKPDDQMNFFEHLAPLFKPFLKTRGETRLRITLISAEPASSTEVVKAMASSQRCGCGCDCGCH